jgi:hypothetical protein
MAVLPELPDRQSCSEVARQGAKKPRAEQGCVMLRQELPAKVRGDEQSLCVETRR